MIKWEYTEVRTSYGLLKALNEHGEEGWEYISHTHQPSVRDAYGDALAAPQITILFKRQKTNVIL